jgi:hypothetical protein
MGGDELRAVVVVEGASDQIAIEALAGRRGIDLQRARIRVVPRGGAQRIGRFVEELGSQTRGFRVAGLCDAAEAPLFRTALDGVGSVYVCVVDLEDELIRALGVAAAEEVVRANGDLARFRKLQQMPAWRGRAIDEQLRRFIGVGARRKARYARLLVDALDPESVPAPLDGVLGHALGN